MQVMLRKSATNISSYLEKASPAPVVEEEENPDDE